MTLRPTFATRSLAVALAVSVSLGLAGCGNENSAKGRASTGSGDVTYAHAALSKDDIMRAAYTAALKAGSAHITMTMSGKARLEAAGDVAYDAHQPTMAMTMSMPQMGQGKMELRFVDGILYLQIPGMTPAGKFVAIDRKDQKSPYAKAFTGMTDQMDPLHSIKAMEKAVQSAERVGKQTIDGVELEHYRVVVDTAALLGQLGSAAKQASVPKTVTYEMWLDDQDLLRRMSFEMTGVSFEAQMSDWGKKVKVSKPAASDIVTMPSPQA